MHACTCVLCARSPLPQCYDAAAELVQLIAAAWDSWAPDKICCAGPGVRSCVIRNASFPRKVCMACVILPCQDMQATAECTCVLCRRRGSCWRMSLPIPRALALALMASTATKAQGSTLALQLSHRPCALWCCSV